MTDAFSNRPADDAPNLPPPSPRDFVTATGGLYAKVGMIALALSCPLSLIATRTTPQPPGTGSAPAGVDDAEPAAAGQHSHSTAATDINRSAPDRARLGSIAWNTAILATLIGALALTAAGWALQGEMTTGPPVGMVVTGLMALAYVAATAAALLSGSWLTAVMGAALAAGAGFLFLLAARSAVVLRLHPPEKSRAELADEGVEAYKERRRRRLQEFE